MDIPRESTAKKRINRRLLYGGAGIAALVLCTLALKSLPPAAPSVSRATLSVDTVKRGPMLIQVHGNGTLVPEEIRWIPAATDGHVEKINLQAGAAVQAADVILELSDPQAEQAAKEAEWQMKEATAELESARTKTLNDVLEREAEAATVKSDYEQAKLQVERNELLAADGLISDLDLRFSRLRAQELAARHEIEQKRGAASADSARSQLAVQQARLEQRRALYRLRVEQVSSLLVRAGIDGVLQQVPVEVGQRVTRGTTLALVARPDRLKAVLKIPETQVRDVQPGQAASIDTRNGIVPGRVIRIDPAVRAGTVTVELAIDDPLPKGARPELNVDGTIDIARLDNALFTGRPVIGRTGSTVTLFRITGGGEAVRTKVKLGRGSVTAIEIQEGLREGDQVILSDTSAWDAYDRIAVER